MQKQNHPLPVPAAGNYGIPPFITVSDTKKTRFIFLHEIIYLCGDGKSTSFYLQQPGAGEKAIVVTSKNLGHYCHLYQQGFMRVSSGVIINRLFLHSITHSNEVHLRVKHNTILLEPKYRKAVKAFLKQLSPEPDSRAE